MGVRRRIVEEYTACFRRAVQAWVLGTLDYEKTIRGYFGSLQWDMRDAGGRGGCG